MTVSTETNPQRKATSVRFSMVHSTNSMYECSSSEFYGPYRHIRQSLDYSYHQNYKKERQWLQDSIIDKLLGEIVTGEDVVPNNSPSSSNDVASLTSTEVSSQTSSKQMCTVPLKPWLIYVAGTKYSGRSATVNQLLRSDASLTTASLPMEILQENGDENKLHNVFNHIGKAIGQASFCKEACVKESSSLDEQDNTATLPRLPILGFVLVDAREIATLLPEYQCYEQALGEDAARNFTFKETGYISEIVTRAALQAGTNVMFYGSLRSVDWYKHYFEYLKKDFHNLDIALLQVVASKEESTSEQCKRVSMAVDNLMSNVDFYCKLQSGKKGTPIEILTQGVTWKSFQATFLQECAYQPLNIRRSIKVKHRGESGFIHCFDYTMTTEENYQEAGSCFYGPYAHLRKALDYSYHKNYTRERQMLQDSIINETLNKAQLIDSKSGEVCTTPTEPFLVFTAGAMGVGKSHTLRTLNQNGNFPLAAFVVVDPDEIRQTFPEYGLYVNHNPEKVGEMTRKEAGYIVELLTLAALQAGKNVLVDGSLRDYEWYLTYFERLRQEYPSLKIMLLHIVAPKEAIYQRAEVSGIFLVNLKERLSMNYVDVVVDKLGKREEDRTSCTKGDFRFSFAASSNFSRDIEA